ncbi:serine aminopeptidase domain-containing protein [Aerococcus sanguinicola]|uniref:serine aminopeptidase domain-containing protein n=1 Tax=unclassified Aerococcus TaxID=2618060 RepID=UPI0008A276F9|nr:MULTISPECIES: alpha/beta hydrolase [unclassified Aerococcus]KAB0645365.1 prolyl oligopeptidase family serine peptidase [Aerococcus sanguinicola]MDK6233741.1 alpha/beta hydrolase [Aerococcus sp. UMB10185]MDK6855821.1 alpha/beta hydrolase [Aerococcus sp. UMB7533]MDK8502650.1 alpha/beta hydrolase [Aerococcus sp. UMB1112A]OFN03886.1 hypothetical protein HMPREF2626_05165 [Aerococcus sp. HMSC062A02]
MYTIRKLMIEAIPCYEYSPQGQENKALPLVIFYHGWTNSKEQGATLAVELVQRGFRVLLPDAYGHGERVDFDQRLEPADFFQVLLRNVQEFPLIKAYYQDQGLLDGISLSVSGLSMGGITTCMLIRSYPEIDQAGVLMGTPQLENYARALCRNYFPEAIEVTDEEKAQVQAILAQMAQVDLSQAADCIGARPIFFWHAVNDAVVPYNLTQEFFDHHQGDHPLYMISDSKAGHRVPYYAFYLLAAFFQACQKAPADQIQTAFLDDFYQRFGPDASDYHPYHIER